MAPTKKAAAKKAPARKAAARRAAAKGVKAGAVLPLSVMGSFSINQSTAASIGTTFIHPNAPTGNRYWFVVVDLTTLNVLVSVAAPDATTVPSTVAPYLAKGGYLVIVTSVVCNFGHLPQGALYTALKNLGAGYELDRLEQINTTLGCGYFTNFSYVFVGTSADDGLPGFEGSSFSDRTVLTLSLLPVTVNGTTSYMPIKLD